MQCMCKEYVKLENLRRYTSKLWELERLDAYFLVDAPYPLMLGYGAPCIICLVNLSFP